ncbi:MAG: hypothetical protein R6V56_00630 [Lentisphaeria bacterium]
MALASLLIFMLVRLEIKRMGSEPPAEKTVQEPDTVEDRHLEPDPLPSKEERDASEALEPPPEPRVEECSHDHLQAPLLAPPTREILYQAGALNGKPQKYWAALEEAEYGCREADSDIVTVAEGKERKQFSQYLKKGQKIVWRLGDLSTDDDLLLRLVAALPAHDQSVKAPAALRILFNGKTVYFRMLAGELCSAKAVLPAAWFEQHGNSVVIDNLGHYPMAFDAVWIEKLSAAGKKLTTGLAPSENIPDSLRRAVPDFVPLQAQAKMHDYSGLGNLNLLPLREFARGVISEEEPLAARTAAGLRYRPGILRETRTHSVLQFLSGTVGFFHHGGTDLRISNAVQPGGFASPLSGKLTPQGYALWTLAQVMPQPGTPRLEFNVTPPEECDYPLPPLFWVGAQHSESAASLLVVRNTASLAPRSVQITLALPWSGATNLMVRHGSCPDRVLKMLMLSDADTLGTEIQKDKLELASAGNGGNIFRRIFDFHDVLFLRLNRPGASFPEPPAAEKEPRQKKSSAVKTLEFDAPVVSEQEIGRFMRRGHVLGANPDFFNILSGAYRVTAGKATPANFGKAEYVPPLEEKSVFLHPGPDASPAALAEGVLFSPGKLREALRAGKALSFWVHPHGYANDSDPVLGVATDRQLFRVKLKAGRWQRIVLPVLEQKTPFHQAPDHIMFVVPRRALGNGKNIKFEINGISIIEDTRNQVADFIGRQNEDGEIYFIVIGAPGNRVALHHRLEYSVDAGRIEVIGHDEKHQPVIRWRTAAQVLEVSNLCFASELDKAVIPYLSERLVRRLREKGLTAIVIPLQTEQ